MALSERLSAAATSRNEAALNRSIVIKVLSSSLVHRSFSLAVGALRFCCSSSAMRACRVASSASMEFMLGMEKRRIGEWASVFTSSQVFFDYKL